MSGWMAPRWATLLLALAFSPLGTSSAQDIQVSVNGLVARPSSSVRIEGLREKTNGFWFGGMVELRMGRVAVSGLGLRGDLNGTGTLGRDGGEISARGRYDALSWAGLEASYTVRAFSSAAGYQRWKEMGVGIVLFHDLLDGAVQVFGRAAYLPWVRVDGQEQPDVALGTETGVSVTPGGVPITLCATYTMERYDFPGAGTRREQFDRISLAVGIPIQRAAGSWVFGRH